MKTDKGIYLVAYIDIIRFSSEISKRSSNSIHRDLKSIWRWANKHISNQEGFSCHFFSDCGFVFLKLFDLSDKCESLEIFIDSLKNLSDKYLDKEFILKGGISYGKIFKSTNLFLGEPIVDAVKLESLCPGPYILFPYNTLNNYYEDISADYADYNDTASIAFPGGIRKFRLILPSNITLLNNKIEHEINISSTWGPFNYTPFWIDAKKTIKQLLEQLHVAEEDQS